MKTASYVLGGVLAFAVCFESLALPPRQHTVSGQIQGIDRSETENRPFGFFVAK